MTDTATFALMRFLDAFSRLDLDGMLDCFTADATAFLPVEHHHQRLEDKAAIRGAFAAVLNKIKAKGRTTLPLAPEDLRMEEWSDIAVATFHLRGDHLSRRTIVLHCQAGQWRIVHLHASNAPCEG
jgi:ketosteroid isomerase-like protein